MTLLLFQKDVMEEKCGSAAICFVAFLPDILDTKAEGRNRYIQMLLSVAEKFKRSPYRLVAVVLLTEFSLQSLCICYHLDSF